MSHRRGTGRAGRAPMSKVERRDRTVASVVLALVGVMAWFIPGHGLVPAVFFLLGWLVARPVGQDRKRKRESAEASQAAAERAYADTRR